MERVRQASALGVEHDARQLSSLRAPAGQQAPPELQRASFSHDHRDQSGKDYHINPPSRRSLVSLAGRCCNTTLTALYSRRDVGQSSQEALAACRRPRPADIGTTGSFGMEIGFSRAEEAGSLFTGGARASGVPDAPFVAGLLRKGSFQIVC